ncbi:MAG: hypothetical protein QQM50_02210 [Dehalococcoides mccartyi]|uniref:hypothetical protein n=1 Tax=Dehalococcoides TaxID=61434 RepID=UPI00080552A7|nr:hypothetical protein [Dehalococcoides mccartyi]MDP4279349.1 hypothetical protein [Dehalococcoides mccartyi]OBW60785.1 MAG: hypothetical protein A9181_05715 [Dehalococcoides mccartyi]
MSETLRTAAFTIIGGTIVFIAGQFFAITFFERIRQQARTIEEISEALVTYAQYYSTVFEFDTEFADEVRKNQLKDAFISAQKHLRTLSGRLRTTCVTLPGYSFFAEIRFVKKRKQIEKASKALIGLSNCIPLISPVTDKMANDFRNEVEEALNLHLKI